MFELCYKFEICSKYRRWAIDKHTVQNKQRNNTETI